jgi:hypothetical protein
VLGRLQRSGHSIGRRKRCGRIFDGKDLDVSKLFVSAEITPDQAIGDAEISKNVDEQLRILEQPTPPDVTPGKQCTAPVVLRIAGRVVVVTNGLLLHAMSKEFWANVDLCYGFEISYLASTYWRMLAGTVKSLFLRGQL